MKANDKLKLKKELSAQAQRLKDENTIDLLLIMDCTGPMEAWINET